MAEHHPVPRCTERKRATDNAHDGIERSHRGRRIRQRCHRERDQSHNATHGAYPGRDRPLTGIQRQHEAPHEDRECNPDGDFEINPRTIGSH